MTMIAISSQGPTLDDQVDPRFGRAGGFVIVDTESMQTSYVDNGGSQAMGHGAGISAAERIAGSGAKTVLTGMVGPKAFMALAAAGIKVAEGLESSTVRQAVELFKSGKVNYVSSPGGGGGGGGGRGRGGGGGGRGGGGGGFRG